MIKIHNTWEEESMNKLLGLGNRYAKESTWKDFAAVKFCLFSMGLMVGVRLHEKCKKAVMRIAALVFLTTYVPLMAKVIRIALKK